MFGAFQAINFYGHTEWVETRSVIFLTFFTHAFKLKIHPPKVFPHMLVQGSHKFAMFMPTCTYECDDLYLIHSKIQYWEPAFILWLYSAMPYLQALFAA